MTELQGSGAITDDYISELKDPELKAQLQAVLDSEPEPNASDENVLPVVNNQEPVGEA